MKFTRFLAFFLAVIMLLSLVSCGKDDKPVTTTASQGEGTTGNGKENNVPDVDPEKPVTGEDLSAFMAKAFNLNVKINNVRDKGYNYSEDSDNYCVFDNDPATILSAAISESNTLSWKFSLPSTLVGYVMYSKTAPKSWKLQASSDSESWVDVDVVGQSNMTANSEAGFGYEIDAAAQAPYSTYRIVFTDIPSDGKIELADIVLIGYNEEKPVTSEEKLEEFYLADGSNLLFVADGATTDGITVDDPFVLFDGKSETKFSANVTAGSSVTLKWNGAATVNSYIINAGEKVPESWSVYVSKDGTNWTLIDLVCKGNLVAGSRNGYDVDVANEQADYIKFVFNTDGDVELVDIELIGFSYVGPAVDGGTWSTYVDDAGRTVYRLEKARPYDHKCYNLYKLGYLKPGQSFTLTLGATFKIPWPNGAEGEFGVYVCAQDRNSNGAFEEVGDYYYLCYSTGLIEKNRGTWCGWEVGPSRVYNPESFESYVVFTIEYDGAGTFKYYFDGVLTATMVDQVGDPFTEGYICICAKQGTQDGPVDFTLYEFKINDN
ncbi:MAG: hypothetical protein J5850_04885 [Clostridia bacterium]|nr:hypothetical protein [Clostridia bacterium]